MCSDAEYISRLTEVIVRAMDEDDLAMLLAEKIDPKEFNFLVNVSGAYKKKVFDTVRWAYQFGQLEHVVVLAEIVFERRKKRNDLKDLIAEMKAAIGQQVQQTTSPSQPLSLPSELSTALELFESQLINPTALARDLRNLLRQQNYQAVDLPGRFHLSDSVGERLAAIVALEQHPAPEYLQWLSERVTVEPPFCAFIASKALTAAAARLDGRNLERLRSAARDAADRLDELADVTPQIVGYDVAARKRQLDVVVTVAEMRSKPGRALLSPADLDRFVRAVVAAFDLNAFDLLCQNRLQMALKRFASLDDPLDIIIIHVLFTARNGGWEVDLIHAVYEERKNDAVFADIHQKYAAPAAAG